MIITSVLFNHQVHVGPVDLHTLRPCVTAKGHRLPDLYSESGFVMLKTSTALAVYLPSSSFIQISLETVQKGRHQCPCSQDTDLLPVSRRGRTLLCQWSEVLFTWILTISFICFRSLGKNIQSFHLHKE